MSWFDATGIASLAKNALKEAQKTIDKALDIKEDEDHDGNASVKSSSSTSSSSIKSGEKNSLDSSSEQSDSLKAVKTSASNPILSTVATATSASNLWGSFTGSFFDASNENNEYSKPAVTIAPTGRTESHLIAGKHSKSNDKLHTTNLSGRTSSTSESVELLSSPITPSSDSASLSGSKFEIGLIPKRNPLIYSFIFWCFFFNRATLADIIAVH